MKNSIISPICILIISAFLISSCDNSTSLEPEKTDPVEIFESVWTDLDENYSYFPLKKIDWDSLYNVYRPTISAGITDDELFTTLSSMLLELKDGHVGISTSSKASFYDGWYKNFPNNFNQLIVRDNYLNEDASMTETNTLMYGFIKNTELAYILVKKFSGDMEDFKPAESFINEVFSNKMGLIIDVRNNGGGNDGITRSIASNFNDKELTYAYVRFKNGPGHNDFEGWQPKILKSVDIPFNKPVAVLTNRSCFSATEDFVLSMREIPNVTVIGDTTGGGSGNPLLRELPNGWRYRFSHWQEVTNKMEYFENIGLFPDIPVWVTSEDEAAGRDTILERAIEHLTGIK